MGRDSVEPYLPTRTRASSCSAAPPIRRLDLQFLDVNGENCMSASPVWRPMEHDQPDRLVVGATFPAEIARARAIVGDMPLLVPGIGAQGGDIEATVKAGKTKMPPA